MKYRSNIILPDLPAAYPMSTDSVLLSRFVTLRKGDRVCDLGAGIGTLSMLLSECHPDCEFVGFELQEEAVRVSSDVIRENGFSNISVHSLDLRDLTALRTQGLFDAAVSNPPYFAAESGALSQNQGRAASRSEESLPLSSLCAAAEKLLKFGGDFFLVHKPERLADLFCALREYRLEPKILRFVKNQKDSIPSLLLLSCRKGGKAGLSCREDLILRNEDGSPSDEYMQIYGIGGELSCPEA